MHDGRPHTLRGYVVALVATATSLVVRWPLWPVLGNAVPQMTFLPAVMIAAYAGGFWPGILATVLSAVAANYFVAGQPSGFHLSDVNDVAAIILFLLVGTIISALCESLHRVRRRLVASEREQAEAAMSETKERFRSLVQYSSDIISLFDAEGTVVYQAPSVERLLGHPPQDRIGQNVFRDPIVHPDDLAAKRAFFDAILSRPGTAITAEFRLRHADGSWRNFEAIGQNCLHDPSVKGIVANYRDITERKGAERALRESEERFRTLAKATNDAVWDWDLHANNVWWNEGVFTLFGYVLERDHADPTWWLERVHPDDREAVEAFFFTVVHGQELSWVDEYRFRCADGSYKDVYDRGHVIRDADGRAVRMIGAMLDITARKRAEQALRESEHRWRSLTEALPQLVWTAAPDGACDYFSSQWTEFTGVPEGELLGWRWMETLHPDDREPTRQAWTAAVEGPGAYDVEYRVRRSDAEYRWFKTRGVPIRDSAGDIFKWFGTCTDITDARIAAEELRSAKEAAESANRAKDEFLANVSHEIRTPMNAILGLTSLVLGTPLTGGQRQSLATVKSAGNNLLGIINDLLDFSKIEAGKLELDPGEFSLRAALGDTLRALAIRAHQKGLELASDVQPDVPDALIGDAGRLRQVLLNIVGNAIKFTQQGEVVVRVNVAYDRPPPSGNVDLLFTVRDTGIGIPPEKHATIFRAFEQEDSSTTRKYGGTGLGLTISAQLAALMGGKVTVQSALGRGSTFGITARFGLAATRGAPTNPTASPDPLKNLRVLIVDDNLTNRQILEEWLENWRMCPTAVGDGAAAMDALRQGIRVGAPYPLMLLDDRMPDADGLTLIGQIRDRVGIPAPRVVLLSSDDSAINTARSRETGISAHLLKPVQQSELLEAIRDVMNRTPGDAGPTATAGPAGNVGDAPFPTTTPLRILVAEDNEFNVTLLKQLFAQRGHTAHIADDGREALALATADTFDLLLLDIHMPKMDGFEVAQAIRAQERTTGRRLPIIAFTARSGKTDREQCLAAGMDDFLSKPVQADALWAVIDRVVTALAPQDTRDPDLLDPQAIRRACGGEAAILEKICQTFQTSVPNQMARVRAALRDNDAPRLRETAHTLSSTLAAFSTVAGTAASTLEDVASGGQLVGCAPLVEHLESMCSGLVLQVRDLSIERLMR